MHKKTQFKVLAIIPAKSKSRRLKDKNRKKINGLELFVHSIKIAQKSKYINKIHISTDSKSIAQKALSYGVQTPFLRPKKLSTYKSPIIKTLIFTIEKFKKESKGPKQLKLFPAKRDAAKTLKTLTKKAEIK